MQVILIASFDSAKKEAKYLQIFTRHCLVTGATPKLNPVLIAHGHWLVDACSLGKGTGDIHFCVLAQIVNIGRDGPLKAAIRLFPSHGRELLLPANALSSRTLVVDLRRVSYRLMGPVLSYPVPQKRGKNAGCGSYI